MSTRYDADAAGGGTGDDAAGDARQQLERVAAAVVPDEHDWAGMSTREIYLVVLRHLVPDYTSTGDTSDAYLRGRFNHAVSRRLNETTSAPAMSRDLLRPITGWRGPQPSPAAMSSVTITPQWAGYRASDPVRPTTARAPVLADWRRPLATDLRPLGDLTLQGKQWVPDWARPLEYVAPSNTPAELEARKALPDWKTPLSYVAKGYDAQSVVAREGWRRNR